MTDLNCPYCNAELEVCHDDGAGYDEDVLHQQECSECEKQFVFETSMSFYYEPRKANCLNGGNHKWEATTTYPIEFTNMMCIHCWLERRPTKKEMDKVLKEREK